MSQVPSAYISDYNQLFDSMIINPDKIGIVDAIAKKISANAARYSDIQKITGVPWYFIGLIHQMESGCDFTRHLHNGDPLTARTTHEPAGRPVTGNPPFPFLVSAVDALQYQGLTSWRDWSIAGMLYKLESFNGLGYRLYHHINSPYLWSFSNQYTRGKYTADGTYDPLAVSQQAGTAVILRRILDQNNLYKRGFGLATIVGLASVVFFCLANNIVS